MYLHKGSVYTDLLIESPDTSRHKSKKSSKVLCSRVDFYYKILSDGELLPSIQYI